MLTTFLLLQAFAKSITFLKEKYLGFNIKKE